jgi:hypothetical protein
MQQPPSPSATPSAYWLMEPSDLATSSWGRREPPCAIHGMGPCLYPVALRQPMFSTLGMTEGAEGAADIEDMVEVIAVRKKMMMNRSKS